MEPFRKFRRITKKRPFETAKDESRKTWLADVR